MIKILERNNIIILAFIIIIDPFPKIVYSKTQLDLNDKIMCNKIIANINYQYLDVTLNKNKTMNIKTLNEAPFPRKKTLYVSPFFSKEKFGKADIGEITKKFEKKKN